MSFFPGFQTSKKGTVVWLVSVGNNSIAADRLIRLDPFSFCKDLFYFLQLFAGARKRGAWRQLHVDTKNALVFIRFKSSRDNFGIYAVTKDDVVYDKACHD